MVHRIKWTGPLRRLRHHLTIKLFGRPSTFTPRLNKSPHTEQSMDILSRDGVHNPFSKEVTTQREHYGPKACIPDLFRRNDQIFLVLEAQRLQRHVPPPVFYHDLLDAAARVGRIEESMGYTFNDKMLCIQALKITSSVIPLYSKGVVHQVDRNHRIALLGDRVLGLALCDIWFMSGNTTADYNTMRAGSESRVSLSARGRAIGIHKNLLLHHERREPPSDDQVAETFEAILGAVYLDSGKSLEAVKKVITQAGLDNHELLKVNAQSQIVKKRQVFEAIRNAERIAKLNAKLNAKLENGTWKQARAAAWARKQATEQTKGQVQEGDTTTKAQKQNASSETAQTQTRNEDNTAPAHREASDDNPVQLDNQDPPTPPPTEVTTSKAEDQPQQEDTESTDMTEEFPLPMEELEGLRSYEKLARIRAWKSAIAQSKRMKEQGFNAKSRDPVDIYEKRLRWWKYKTRVEEFLKMRALSAASGEMGGYEEGPAEVQCQKDPADPLQLSPETIQAPESLSPGLLNTTITRADPVTKDMGPASIMVQQKGFTANGSDKTNVATSTVPAPTRVSSSSSKETDSTSSALRSGEVDEVTSPALAPSQEVSGSLQKTRAPALKASQQEPSPALWNGETEEAISPASVPVQKLSSSPEVASKDRNEPTQELSGREKEADSASASDIVMHNVKGVQVQTDDVDQLRRDIVNSRKLVWEPAAIRQRNKRIASARRSLQNSLVLAEQLTRHTPANRPVARARFDFYESDTERFIANNPYEDSGAPETPRLESKKKPKSHIWSIQRVPRRRYREKRG